MFSPGIRRVGLRMSRSCSEVQILQMTKQSPFHYFKISPKVVCLAVMFYMRFTLSLREVEDRLRERGIEISHETVRYW